VIDDLVKLLDSLSRLAGAIVLPIAVFAVFWIFRVEINALLRRTESLSIKGGPVDVTLSAAKAQAAGAIAAAVAAKPVADADARTTAATVEAAATRAADAVTPRSLQQARSATVLWVDDNPDNNILVRRGLEGTGVRFVLAESTEEALRLVGQQTFDTIISDMSRGLDKTAGYKLLEQLRKAGIKTPYIIYAGSTSLERRAEAKKRGAVDVTNRPDELFQLVLASIGGNR
jgi:CheY-like chemotaxis protein